MKKKKIAKQLSAAVRTQMDETRIGLNCIVEGNDICKKIKKDFLGIDQFCIKCKDLIHEYNDIKQVSLAGVNLATTIQLRNEFNNIPIKIATLKSELDENDESIKQIYRSLRQLISLRDKAYEQSITYSLDFREQLIETFAKLQELADFVEERIWENIEDFDSLCQDNRLAFLRTMEVIVMEDKAKRKMFARLDAHIDDQAKHKTMKARFFDVLDKTITDAFIDLLKESDSIEDNNSSSTSSNDLIDDDESNIDNISDIEQTNTKNPFVLDYDDDSSFIQSDHNDDDNDSIDYFNDDQHIETSDSEFGEIDSIFKNKEEQQQESSLKGDKKNKKK